MSAGEETHGGKGAHRRTGSNGHAAENAHRLLMNDSTEPHRKTSADERHPAVVPALPVEHPPFSDSPASGSVVGVT